MNLVISQALATGLPVITTMHSGLPEQIIDGKNGYLVAEGDYEALAEKIIFFMDHSEKWPQFSSFGRKHVEINYNSNTLINMQIEYYKKVINSV
jgi:colanic acid/amylovoran biosynthesis glycosyltransferase